MTNQTGSSANTDGAALGATEGATEAARETRLKMLKIRSWRRGTKEMDLLLGPFSDRPLRDLADADLDIYEALLEEADQDLYEWCSSGTGFSEEYGPIIARIRAFHEID